MTGVLQATVIRVLSVKLTSIVDICRFHLNCSEPSYQNSLVSLIELPWGVLMD